jgi:flagella basal body P-ring formation protein FlgA
VKTQLQHRPLIYRGISAVFIGGLLALGQAEAAFTLKTKCEVNGDGVYLSDLLESKIEEAIPAIMIDVSPSWGTIREYSSQDLIKLINEKAQGVEVVSSKADIKTSISRSSRALGSREVLELLRVELLKSHVFKQGELELESIRPWKTLLVPDGPVELRMVSKINYPTSQTSLRFQLMDGGVPFGVFSAPVKMSLWKEAWVATGQITRGNLLPKVQLERQRVNMIMVRQDLWEGDPSDGRYWFRENISPGRLVYSRAVVMKPVVRRGSLAKAVVSTGLVRVSTSVKVLEDGAPGEAVRVQNIRTRKELIGEVLDENTIKITGF